MPYDTWSGFCYNELGWTPNEFWQSTVWDIVSALIYFNNKHAPNKPSVNKKELIEFRKNMLIKGLI